MNTGSSFKQKHMRDIQGLADYYRKHLLSDIVPFWEERVLDREYGGYFTCFDREGRLDSDTKSGWFAGRTLYMFSALYNKIEKREKWLEIARAGRRFLIDKVMKPDLSFRYMMHRDGSPIDGHETLFTDHFAIKGLLEYMEATGEEGDMALAGRLLDALKKKAADPETMTAESHDPRFLKHAVYFMNLIVGIEGKRLFGDQVKSLIDEGLAHCLYIFADEGQQAPLEYVSVEGKPLYEGIGRIVDPGHTMESLWFAMREGMERGDAVIIDRASRIVDWVIDRAWDEEYGGFYQNVDVFDTVPQGDLAQNRYIDTDVSWQDKIWWIQSEALYTLALSALLTENDRHFEYFMKLHAYCKDRFADNEYGEWYNLLRRDGGILSDKKGTELKGPYHIPRSVMQLALLFERYAATGG